MPYQTLADLPDAVKELPKHAQEIYQAAFNSAWEQYKDRGDQREALAHATAWSAVERAYEKRNGRWVAKEVKEAKMTTTKLSDENRRNLLQTALLSEYGMKQESPIPQKLSIESVFDDAIIYEVDGQWYQSSYELGEDDTPIFGEAKRVLSTKIFKAIESLQSSYAEIIQEIGRRNASLDSTRIKKIVELCQELLSSDEPEEEKTKEAIKESASVLKWLREQEAMKTEDGQKYPAEAFAYVPDNEKPSTWKLRMWEDPTKKVTRAQLGRAAAALGPGGFRGQRVQIPVADLTAVKRKIRAEYRKLDVDVEDMPRQVRESWTEVPGKGTVWKEPEEIRERVINYLPLTEAKFDKGRATVVVIKPGFNASEDRYYPAEMLKHDFKVFEGMKMYSDHPTEAEDKARPERSIKDWVATLIEVTCDEDGTVTGVAELVEPWLMQKLASLRDKKMLSEMGISINAVGKASKATIDGKKTLVIEELVACNSVDFVTEPGAGGVVTFYESDRSRDVDLVELSALRERRPDLIRAIEASVRVEITEEVKRMSEQDDKIKELELETEKLTTENAALKNKITEAEKDQARAEAQATIKEAVDKAELPGAAKEMLIERFKGAESAEGVEEAIQSEKDYIARLSESGKVRNLGPGKEDNEKGKQGLRESTRRIHPDWTDAQIETAVIGR